MHDKFVKIMCVRSIERTIPCCVIYNLVLRGPATKQKKRILERKMYRKIENRDLARGGEREILEESRVGTAHPTFPLLSAMS